MNIIKPIIGLVVTATYAPTIYSAEVIDLELLPEATTIQESVAEITSDIYTAIDAIPEADRSDAEKELYKSLDYIVQNAETTDTEILTAIGQFYNAISPKANTANTVVTKKSPGNFGIKDIGKRLSSLRKTSRILSFSRYMESKEKNNAWNLLPSYTKYSNPTESGGLFDQRFSGFLTANIISSDQSETITEAGFESSTKQYTLGGDYRYNNKTFIGIAYSGVSGNVDMSAGRGQLDNNAKTYIVYANYNYDQSWFSNATISYGNREFEMKRAVNFVLNNETTTAVALSNPNSDYYGLSIGGGYDKPYDNGHNLAFLANLNFTRTNIDAFTETGTVGYNIAVAKQTIQSIQLDLGAEWRQAISTSYGVVIPQISLSWTQEFGDKSDAINARYETDPNETTLSFETGNSDLSYINLVLGASMVFPRGLSGFLQYESQQFVDDYQQYMLSIGVRKEF